MGSVIGNFAPGSRILTSICSKISKLLIKKAFKNIAINRDIYYKFT